MKLLKWLSCYPCSYSSTDHFNDVYNKNGWVSLLCQEECPFARIMTFTWTMNTIMDCIHKVRLELSNIKFVDLLSDLYIFLNCLVFAISCLIILALYTIGILLLYNQATEGKGNDG